MTFGSDMFKPKKEDDIIAFVSGVPIRNNQAQASHPKTLTTWTQDPQPERPS